MILGVEIGGTKLQAGDGQRLVRWTVQRRAGRAGILRQLEQGLPPLLTGVTRIGVGFGGPVEGGRVVTSHQVAGWRRFPLQRWFERRFGLPTVVENDSNCAGLAEARQGAGRGKARVFYCNVGTGIGGAFVWNGQLYNGRFGAMEFGHLRLADGRTLESVASGLAIERGVSTLAEAGRHVGAMLANVITLLNPDLVVVGGGVVLAGEKFLRPVREVCRRLVFAPFRGNYRIVPARLGEAVVVVGAILVAEESR